MSVISNQIRKFYKNFEDQSKTTLLLAHDVPVSKDKSTPSKVLSKIAITITTELVRMFY